MRIGAAFPSTYLKAADLQGRQVTVTMSRVEIEDISGGDRKPVLYFQNKEKGLVLNKTNSNIISAVFGDETDDWVGQSVQLYEAMVDFQGKQVPAIRLKVVRPAVQRAAPPRAPEPPVDYEAAPLDDESIPF